MELSAPPVSPIVVPSVPYSGAGGGVPLSSSSPLGLRYTNPFEQFDGRFVLKIGDTVATRFSITAPMTVAVNDRDVMFDKISVSLVFPAGPGILERVNKFRVMIYKQVADKSYVESSMFGPFAGRPVFFSRVPVNTNFCIIIYEGANAYYLGTQHNYISVKIKLSECDICTEERVCYKDFEVVNKYQKNCSCRCTICKACFTEITRRNKKCPFCRTPLNKVEARLRAVSLD